MAPQKPSVKGKGKKLPAAPLSSSRAKRVQKHPMFEKTPRSFRLGGDILPKKDLSRYVRWPKYILLQRQRSVLLKRLKVPPAIHQFQAALDKNQSNALFKLMEKYKPETRIEKKDRLRSQAAAVAQSEDKKDGKKPVMLKFGLNHVTDLVEIKKAKLVVIAHDVDPIELVLWLPAVCRRYDVPFCIVKDKARLGQLVHKKNASCIAIDAVRKEDIAELESLCKTFRAQYNDNVEIRRKWGGGGLGIKSTHAELKKERAIALEKAKKMGMQI